MSKRKLRKRKESGWSGRKELQQVLDRHNVNPDIDSLEGAGCDREWLMAALQLAELDFLKKENWEELAGMELRQLKQAISGIKSCANLIDRLNHSELISQASFYLRDPRFVGIRQPMTLSDRLREYAEAVESLQRGMGPGNRTWLHVWKARLVAYVMERTGRPYDRELSGIIGAVLGCKYSESAQQAWRLDHLNLIEREKERLLQRSSRRTTSLG